MVRRMPESNTFVFLKVRMPHPLQVMPASPYGHVFPTQCSTCAPQFVLAFLPSV